MNRTEVIQKIIDQKRARKYLEIGVAGGLNFFPIKVLRKIAVDPKFAFKKKTKKKWKSKNKYNFLAKYHEIISDDYFARKGRGKRFDVIFIDGLHTHEQSLKDVLNSLNCLNENGVIIMHDCSPPHAASAQPAQSLQHAIEMKVPGWTSEWCGDVWKTICYLRSQRKDLKIFVLDCDYGLGIVTKENSETRLELSEEALANMSYEDLSRDRNNLLNLKKESYLEKFLRSIPPKRSIWHQK
jgi:hypothetical protein